MENFYGRWGGLLGGSGRSYDKKETEEGGNEKERDWTNGLLKVRDGGRWG